MAVRKRPKPLLFVLIALVVVVIVTLGTISYLKSPVDSKDDNIIQVEIPAGSRTTTIAKILKDRNLIKSETYFKVYVKIHNIKNLKASTYDLKKSMSLPSIINTLVEGNNYNPNTIKLTFKEGKRVTDYIALIADNTNNTKEEVEKVFADKKYLNELITKYWFLTDEILNSEIYYPLEGYLFPDTYYFNDKDVTVSKIIETMLDEMKNKLNDYKNKINNSQMTTHEILTLASIIEKEGKTGDFKDISSVFHNRLNISMKLQSCATSYYGLGLEFTDVGIATAEMMNSQNPYNTYIVPALPVGPISMPSLNAIEAAINPKNTNNLYFISDNEGKTYFFETAKEHADKKNELIAAGKWER
ncbi:MAG: endolytic transglycosylase MltG [Tenericutes bacterium]|nr:endolytic transglycosylase MltG [Mycoplasmatota bacterium]